MTQSEALLRNPDNPQALVNRFQSLAQQTKAGSDVHLALMRRAVSIAPKQFEAVFNYGSALMRMGRFHESLVEFKRALDLAPPSHKALALQHVGMAHHDIGDFSAAIDWYDKAIAVDPDDVELRQSRAIALLANGKLGEGLFDFEVRWHKPARKPIAESGIPRWQGESLIGKHLIVAHEQGFGDTIQFSRIIPHLNAERITFSGPPNLTGMIADNCAVDSIVGEDGPFSADFYCSPISAFGALNVQYYDVDGSPYISAEPMRLPERGLKVGLVWRGSSSYAQDALRSPRLEDFAPLFEIPGTGFYSLQVGEFAGDVSRLGLDGFIADLTCMIKDWRDTARAVAAMDVVVTCDTSTAHLAGAMGKPVLILLPYSACWRWMRDSDVTPWYRSAKLFRQHVPGEWSYPVENIKRELEKMLGQTATGFASQPRSQGAARKLASG